MFAESDEVFAIRCLILAQCANIKCANIEYHYQTSNVQIGANFVGEVGRCQFSCLLRLYCGEGPCSVIWSSYEMLLIDPPQKSHYD